MPDDLALLTGASAGDLLAAALATTGEELLSWRLRQVDHRPGRSTTAAYDASVRGPDGERSRLLAAGTGLPPGDAPGVLRLSDGEQEVAVWRFPHDPGLPALAAAAEDEPVRALLASYGVEAGPLELRVRTYRPGRRAVVEVRTRDARLFLKVLRPSAAEDLHRRHVLLRDADLPVPRSLGWSDQGLVVLEALPGAGLRARLREATAPDLPGEVLLDLLGRMPTALRALPRRRSWTDEVDHYAGVLAAALPSEADRCLRLADRVRAVTSSPAGDEPVHGDLYEAQLLVDGDRLTGLLDLDGAGPGRRADDLACLLAHLAVLAHLEPDRAAAPAALLERWLPVFERAVDPADLRGRVAGVVVSLATGPHRVQTQGWQEQTRGRLALAEHWLDRR